MLKVSPDHYVFSVSHLFHGHELLETRSDAAVFGFTDSNLLVVKLITLGVDFACGDFTNSEVALDESLPLFSHQRSSRGGLGLGFATLLSGSRLLLSNRLLFALDRGFGFSSFVFLLLLLNPLSSGGIGAPGIFIEVIELLRFLRLLSGESIG